MRIKFVITILSPFLFLFLLNQYPFQLKGKEILDYNLEFVKGSKGLIDLNNLDSSNFKPFPRSNSFGYKKGTYWIKLKILKTDFVGKYIVHIPTHNINKIEIYKKEGSELEFQGITGNSLRKEKIELEYQFPSFSVLTNNKENTYYFLKVEFLKEANFPLKILNQSDFVSYVLNKKTINSLYYGTCIVVIVINLLFFVKIRDKTYLFYALFLISLMINFLIYDGSLINPLRGNSLFYYLEFIIHFTNEICFLLFSVYFLKLNETHPQKIKLLAVFPVLVLFFYVLYFYTDNFVFVAIGDAIGISIFPILWFIGIFYMRIKPFVKFYVYGYLLLIPLSVFFIIGYPFGFWKVDGDMLIVKIASWLDIFVFTYAISHRVNLEFKQSFSNINQLEEKLANLNLSKNYETKQNPLLWLLTVNEITNKPLTMRELEIVEYLCMDLNKREVGEKLFISSNTVKYHVRNIYFKFEVKSREELKNKLAFKNQKIS